MGGHGDNDAVTWAEVGRKQGDKALQDQIDQLKERIEILELALGIHKVTAPVPVPPAVNPNAARDDFYRQAGVKW
jgi:hypothetical protein